jgi:hypothetical protein
MSLVIYVLLRIGNIFVRRAVRELTIPGRLTTLPSAVNKLALLILFLLPVALSAQNRPLKTEFVETVGKGSVRFELGFEFLQDAKFELPGLKGDLTRIGVLGLRFGAGENVEIHFDWTAQNFLNIDKRFDAPNSGILDFDGDSTSDFGDLILATKIRLFREKGDRPALGFRFAAELPNASNESGLGNDQTNFYAGFLLQKAMRELRLIGNLGIAILGDPTKVSSQKDLVTYGVAAIYPIHPQVSIFADLNGRAGSGGVGTEERSILRFGGLINALGLRWDLGFLAGLRDTDPSTGVIVGLSHDFNLPSF